MCDRYLTAHTTCYLDNDLTFDKGKQYYVAEIDNKTNTIYIYNNKGYPECFDIRPNHKGYIGKWFNIQ